MNISMDKTYTLNGLPFTVSMVSKPGPLPVLGYDNLGNVSEFTAHGHYGPSSLVEVSPYADFVIDEKVMVRDQGEQNWHRNHFVGISAESGQALTSSFTRWMQVGVQPGSWIQCRRPTAEELAS